MISKHFQVFVSSNPSLAGFLLGFSTLHLPCSASPPPSPPSDHHHSPSPLPSPSPFPEHVLKEGPVSGYSKEVHQGYIWISCAFAECLCGSPNLYRWIVTVTARVMDILHHFLIWIYILYIT
ncbi:hypothetical protein L1987_32790 [Smallanthus sonchifolius]|uniref:Uncharacterized protein n=1 Tax=Smallanthus sonchifolius TaxID=185202 RepID=A0ACB9HRU1_9ASTR|nr:hypothetical protein L1987_32790 [Smallanthus sonchifolius]